MASQARAARAVLCATRLSPFRHSGSPPRSQPYPEGRSKPAPRIKHGSGAIRDADRPAPRQNRGSGPEPWLRKAPAIAGRSASEFRLAVSGSQARCSHQDRTRTSEAPIRVPPPIRPARYGRAGARERRDSSAGEATRSRVVEQVLVRDPAERGQAIRGGRIRLAFTSPI
jgi:hypothetical protein